MGKSTYRLVMRRGPTPGLIIELSKSDMTIGRDLSNEFVVNDVEVSRKHLRILLQGDQTLIEDLGSTNGSFINGQRLTGVHVLVPGELLSLGEHVTLVYEAVAYDPAATQVSGASAAVVKPISPIIPEKSPAQRPVSQAELPPTARPSSLSSEYKPDSQQTGDDDSFAPVQYSGQIPESPAEEDQTAREQPRKRRFNLWLLAGGGCLLVVLCLLIAFWVFIDQPWSDAGLYCSTPFDIIFRYFGYCP